MLLGKAACNSLPDLETGESKILFFYICDTFQVKIPKRNSNIFSPILMLRVRGYFEKNIENNENRL